MRSNAWLCPNHPFGHRWINPPFPNHETRCENCGITPKEAETARPTARHQEA